METFNDSSSGLNAITSVLNNSDVSNRGSRFLNANILECTLSMILLIIPMALCIFYMAWLLMPSHIKNIMDVYAGLVCVVLLVSTTISTTSAKVMYGLG